MSLGLVAYGSSDESETSDTEGNNVPAAITVAASSKFTDDLKNSDQSSAVENGDGTGTSSLDGKLRELPEPKSQSVSVIDENDELEDEVKPKPSQVADAPKPPTKQARKPVQITIPALPDDEEEKEPVKKKPKLGPTTVKSGLTSLLPAPVHAARKEANRILLPYTLTKKVNPNPTPPIMKKPVAVVGESSKVKSLTTSLADYGSDSDENEENSDEPVNFFSLGSTSKSDVEINKVHKEPVTVTNSRPVEQNVPLPPVVSRTSLSLPAPVKKDKQDVNQSESSEINKSAYNSESDTKSEGDSKSSSQFYGSTVDPDAPLSFKGGASHSYPTHSSRLGTGMNSQQMMYSVEYAGPHSYPEADDEQALQQDDQFLRLQGKKMRGKEEINIVDVNADDFTSPTEISKYISEEQPQQSHRKKDSNLPTHQQKRKHQIQYLAFEAKERELELKNQWSNNKMTKKQTQAKYGF